MYVHPKFIPAALTLIMIATSVQAQITLTPIDEKYAADEVRDLMVSVADADVTVNTSDVSTVEVQVTVEGDDRDKAMDYYEKQNFSVTLDRGTLHVHSKRERTRRTLYVWRNSVNIHVAINMPSNISSNIRTSDGDLVIGELTAGATIVTSDGDIEAAWLEGASVSIKTSDGDISILAASGEKITIQTSDGDIEAGRLEGASISVRTSDGDLELGDVAGDLQIQTSDGDIMIDSINGKLDAKTSDGDLAIGEVISSNAEARTSDGEITIGKATGSLTLRTSDGDVALGLVNPENINVTISSGDAVLTMPQDLPATLNIRAKDVEMDSLSNFSGDLNDSRVDADLNGGGALIRVHISDGDVVMRATEQ
ncbi:MAG: DUF4097 domain-containing protein [Rhodothermaceae bacterium]|nr:DUF4097 domain-containing protein [Rhodothermaceae bacterium]MXW34018.1 DUF4097 domain-containing protein [Rhodothermaceae bacterium]MYC03052.1 DUF4097 domain-containing protein [Rhodothermaceae bacterium]MYE62514.1 DUF4097 domain-containing protein [Rhodothermaceae bacterium]MYI18210.1 DUF4097 domain-containing protein [Rhodothermaceae bacterium]